MIDLDRSRASDPLLNDRDRRRLHADLQRITLEMRRFAHELEHALTEPELPVHGPAAQAAEQMRAQLKRAMRCVAELDDALAVLSEPECDGC